MDAAGNAIAVWLVPDEGAPPPYPNRLLGAQYEAGAGWGDWDFVFSF
jgi:hypothetical protein